MYIGCAGGIDTSFVPVCDTTYVPVSPWCSPAVLIINDPDPLYWIQVRDEWTRRPEAWEVDSLVMVGCERRPVYDSVLAWVKWLFFTGAGRMEWRIDVDDPARYRNGGYNIEQKMVRDTLIDSTWTDIYDTIWKPRKVVFE